MMRIRRLMIAAIALCGLVGKASAFQGASARFQVLHQTTSPNRRYALAWGIRGHPRVDFTRLHNEGVTGHYADTLGIWSRYPHNTLNCILDLSSGAIVAVIPSASYFPGQNYGDVHATRCADSHNVVVAQDGRWEPVCVVLVEVAGSHKGQVNVLQRIVRDTLSASGARAPDGQALAVEVEVRSLSVPGWLVVQSTASVPKSEDDTGRTMVLKYPVRIGPHGPVLGGARTGG